MPGMNKFSKTVTTRCKKHVDFAAGKVIFPSESDTERVEAENF
jgi:hypothetical protein